MCVCFGHVSPLACLHSFSRPPVIFFLLLLYASCEARVVTSGCSPPHVTNVSPVRTSSPVQTCAVKFSHSSPKHSQLRQHQPAQKTTTAHLSFLTFHPQRKKWREKRGGAAVFAGGVEKQRGRFPPWGCGCSVMSSWRHGDRVGALCAQDKGECIQHFLSFIE